MLAVWMTVVNSNSNNRSIPPVMSNFQSNQTLTPSNTQYPYSGGPYFHYSLPPPVMPGEQTCTLWCLVDSDDAPFDVTAYNSNNISHLKEVIKEKRQRLLSNQDAPSLELWNVRIFYRLA